MSGRKKRAAKAAPEVPAEWTVPTDKIVNANYLIAQPFGGGMLGTPKRYHVDQFEHDAIRILSEACDEVPALRALADWAESNGAPEMMLEALEAARHGARWAVEGRPQPETHKSYRAERMSGYSPSEPTSTT